MLANEETIQLIYDVLNKRGYIDIPSFGYSMYPFIKKGDLCRFVPIQKSSLKKGDVLLYINETGQLIGHRFYYKTKDGLHYVLKGDTNLSYDPQVHVNQLIGKMIVIKRGDQELEANRFWLKVYGKVMVTLPILSHSLNRMVTRRRRKEMSAGVGATVQTIGRSKKDKDNTKGTDL